MLEPGTRLGPYEIQAPIGAGGMGEVYRARDTRLDRTVAVKILPTQFAGDPSLRERFDREARLISSLNHPHICSLFDVGEQNGVAFLVVEHLEGETLATRLEKGKLPLEQALKVAVQLAGALDAAHRMGVVHRDVKPGNVMLTKAGAKLLDFGLARSEPLLSGVHGSSLLPTTPAAVTAQGTILGTLQYMSPEQLDGSEADSRSDIFAFGALVYEMVTGRKAFEGKTQASLIAAIMSADPPPMSTLQPVAPAPLDRVIRKCLAKDPDERWQSAKDLGDELNWIGRAESTSDAAAPMRPSLAAAPSRSSREAVLWIVAAALGVALIGALITGRSRLFGPPDEPLLTYRTSIVLPQGASMETVAPGRRVALSPDGRVIAFLAINPDRQRLLWLRPVDSMSARPIAGTEGVGNAFWSPDSKFIGFVAQGQLKKVEVAGGPPITIASEASAVGGAWNRDGVILYAARSRALFRVNASGGTPVAVVEAPNKSDLMSDPAFLSDGRHFLYQVSQLAGGGERSGIYVGSLDSKEAPKRLLSLNSNAIASRGYLLYARDRVLMAQPFDEARLELSGTPAVIGQDLEMGSVPISASFSLSDAGTLAFRTGASGVRTQLTWFDRKGVQQGTVGDAADEMTVALSPDGSRVVVSGLDAARNTRDLWVVDVARKLRTRFTFDPADEMSPVWSSDGRNIFFGSRRSGRLDIFSKPASGAGSETELLTDNQNNLYPTGVSSDGKFLLFFTGNALSTTGNDLWVLPLTGDPKPKPFLQTEFNETYAVFSPDGRWVAYNSIESGHTEVYVASFPGPGGKWQISQGGGSFPRWRGDSAELYFISAEGPLMAASVDGRGSAFVVGQVTPLFQPRIRNVGFAGSNSNNYDVARDGQRFLVAVSESSPTETPITLVVNWSASLK
jgi:serine/threonine protein kinase/Tol biopolymer transport system component